MIELARIKSEQIIVRLSPKLKRSLEKKAEDKQTTVSELVRLLIETMLIQDNLDYIQEWSDKQRDSKVEEDNAE